MNGAPIFQSVFGNSWDALPPVMRKHYAVRANSEDTVTVKGWLDVKMAWPVRVVSKLLRVLVPYSGDKVPVHVTFTSTKDGHFHFDRTFAFSGKPLHHFRSQMQPVGNNELIEWMGYGVGWRCAYAWDGEKVILLHRGYAFRLFGLLLPIPLSLLLGKGYAEETPLSDKRFAMWTHTKHPLFGEMFRYGGEFEVVEHEK